MITYIIERCQFYSLNYSTKKYFGQPDLSALTSYHLSPNMLVAGFAHFGAFLRELEEMKKMHDVGEFYLHNIIFPNALTCGPHSPSCVSMIPISQRYYVLAPCVQPGHHYRQLVCLRPRIRKQHHLRIYGNEFFNLKNHFA